jgi:hypothetical protein
MDPNPYEVRRITIMLEPIVASEVEGHKKTDIISVALNLHNKLILTAENALERFFFQLIFTFYIVAGSQIMFISF